MKRIYPVNNRVGSEVHILLVDDRAANLDALEKLLKREGLHILKASSGSEALEFLLVHEVALALIDVQMPEMDGFELAELMRGSERTRRVPIVFLTAGITDQQRRFRGYEMGAVDFLSKPIEPDVLRSKVNVFIDLFCQRQEVARQRDELAKMNQENMRLLAESQQFAAALQEADRRKDEFLATLAHELRNPLAPILSGVQVLSMTCKTPQDIEEVAEVCEIVERQVHQMVRLVDDLLELGRITNGKIELKTEDLDLNDVVKNAVETSSPQILAGRHRLQVLLSDAPVMLHGDMVRLIQVVSNLLNNSAKYTPEGGKIHLQLTRTNGWARVSVRDSGLGIPQDMLDKVFDMFTQINDHQARCQGGLGIGLALVKRIVELHQGTVSVSSGGENLGAEFTIGLPLVNPELVNAAQQEELALLGEGRAKITDL
jgi:signal transduction histidine kinase